LRLVSSVGYRTLLMLAIALKDHQVHCRGEPVMASQIVVDETELDPEGFLNPYPGKHSALNDLAAEIRSLELRASAP
jgi:hypothetical protein